MDVTLYYAPSSCSRIPLIALEEIGCPFEARVVAFARGDHRVPEYLALNPAGKVPTLVVDGVAIGQNSAILTCLARLFPDSRLLPDAEGPIAQAKLLSQVVRFSADIHPLVTRIRVPQFFCDLPQAIARVHEMACDAMRFQLQDMDKSLQQHLWLFGDDWSVLDAYLYWVWFRITGAGFDGSAFPGIGDHAARMAQRPAVQRALKREEEAMIALDAQGLLRPPPLPGQKG